MYSYQERTLFGGRNSNGQKIYLSGLRVRSQRVLLGRPAARPTDECCLCKGGRLGSFWACCLWDPCNMSSWMKSKGIASRRGDSRALKNASNLCLQSKRQGSYESLPFQRHYGSWEIPLKRALKINKMQKIPINRRDLIILLKLEIRPLGAFTIIFSPFQNCHGPVAGPSEPARIDQIQEDDFTSHFSAHEEFMYGHELLNRIQPLICQGKHGICWQTMIFLQRRFPVNGGPMGSDSLFL